MIIPINQYLVPLSQDKFAIVDAEGWEKVRNKNWSLSSRGYAVGHFYEGTKRKQISMHSFLTGFKITDHINRDKLDNRHSNLRECTESQNQWNHCIPKHNTSGYKGVYWMKSNKKWASEINCYGKKHFLGLFEDKVDAAKAYNKAALKYFGEFARLNIIE